MKSLTQYLTESHIQENYSEKEFKVLYDAVENKDDKKLIAFVEKTYRRRQDGDLYDDFDRLNQDEYSTICALKKDNKEAIIATKEYGNWIGAWVHDNKIEYIETEVFDMIDKTWKAWYLSEYDDELETIILQNI